MSVTITVYGAERDSDEYLAAQELKRIIQDGMPRDAIGEIILFASATLMGQDVKDVDILMIGQLHNYAVKAEFSVADQGIVTDNVEIASFCVTIEVKRHDISRISLNGTDFYVKYNNRNHCVTAQSNKQKLAAMDFFMRTLGATPFVTNVIWFTQATSTAIRGLLTNNRRTMPSNVLGNTFCFRELMQLLIWQRSPRRRGSRWVFDSNYHSSSLPAIQNALSLFSQTKSHMGALTRRRIEYLTNSAFDQNALVDSNGKVSIYRGRAGTGKTVGLIQTAIHLVDEDQARVLMLTYNKALVSDIRRLFALAELPDMFDESCLYINTMHSYFFRLASAVLYDSKLNGTKFIQEYDNILTELLEFMKDEDGIQLALEICRSDVALDWDYVLIDEAQDWSSLERDLILKLFDKGRIIVADGGQQFVRRIDVCDWSIIRERNNIKLKYCLRQKENLVSFLNAYTQHMEILGGKVTTKKNMPGGKVIITDDTGLYDIHNQEMSRLKEAGNIAYDMLYLVPHALVGRKEGDSHFVLKQEFESRGIFVWDGTSRVNRDGYSIDAEEIRLLQYDSARGLEGWTVVCMDLDVFLEEKDREYVAGKVDSLMLESPAERKKKYLYNWIMIPFTRAIDTLIITLKDPDSEVAQILREIAHSKPDFVSWM